MGHRRLSRPAHVDLIVNDLDHRDRVAAEAALVRGAVLKIGPKLLIVLLADFVLMRILAPNLVNMHQDMALIGAIFCSGAALGATLWLGFQLWVDLRRFFDDRRQLRRAPSLRVIEK